MNLEIEEVGNVSVIELLGDHLDASNATGFRDAIEPCVAANACLVLDLSQLTFVDSSGLGVLISCLRRLNGMGGDLKLCGMLESVHGLFSLVRMDRVFEIHDTRDQALNAF